MSASFGEQFRLFPLPPQENLSERQISDFHEYAARLYRMARMKFGIGISGEVVDDTNFMDRVRYYADGRLITIIPDEAVYFEGIDPAAAFMNVVVETPIPSTDSWPNAYVRENYYINNDESFEYSLSITEYTPEGRLIIDRNQNAIMGELFPDSLLGLTEEELASLKSTVGDGLNNATGRKIKELRDAFPKEMEEFQTKCSPDHFLSQLDRIVDTTKLHELGCQPNPYNRANINPDAFDMFS
jgi:hypothetical protein